MRTSTNRKKYVVAVLLAACILPAMAEWTLVGESDSGTGFVDLKTIRKSGNIRKFWMLINYLKPTGTEGYLSARVRAEIDCKEAKIRLLSSSTHTKAMASGETLSDLPVVNIRWSDIPPETVTSATMQAVCAKR